MSILFPISDCFFVLFQGGSDFLFFFSFLAWAFFFLFFFCTSDQYSRTRFQSSIHAHKSAATFVQEQGLGYKTWFQDFQELDGTPRASSLLLKFHPRTQELQDFPKIPESSNVSQQETTRTVTTSSKQGHGNQPLRLR